MAGDFKWVKFSDIDLHDVFFDSLKAEYEEFSDWYQRKSSSGAQALVSKDEQGVTSFLYLKEESEEILLSDGNLPPTQRIKIGTFKIDQRLTGIRQGEGTLGIALWNWQKSMAKEIYVTVFPKQVLLINMLRKFGFKHVGDNPRGEWVFIKSRDQIDFSTPYSSFPFIDSSFSEACLLPIEDEYHDKLFPYSELYRNELDVEAVTAGNGVSKVFIGFPAGMVFYASRSPLLVYRKYNGSGKKTYNSVITSFCTVTRVLTVKSNGIALLDIDSFLAQAGNKAIFSTDELVRLYEIKSSLVLIEMVYNGFLGKGNNVNHHWLNENGLMPAHPYQVRYSPAQFARILEKGKVNVQNVIIN